MLAFKDCLADWDTPEELSTNPYKTIAYNYSVNEISEEEMDLKYGISYDYDTDNWTIWFDLLLNKSIVLNLAGQWYFWRKCLNLSDSDLKNLKLESCLMSKNLSCATLQPRSRGEAEFCRTFQLTRTQAKAAWKILSTIFSCLYRSTCYPSFPLLMKEKLT